VGLSTPPPPPPSFPLTKQFILIKHYDIFFFVFQYIALWLCEYLSIKQSADLSAGIV